MELMAVEVLTEQQIATLPQDAELIGTRWVHAGKNRKTRTKKTIDQEHPLAAKSRIVVQGNQERNSEIRSEFAYGITPGLQPRLRCCCDE